MPIPAQSLEDEQTKSTKFVKAKKLPTPAQSLKDEQTQFTNYFQGKNSPKPTQPSEDRQIKLKICFIVITRVGKTRRNFLRQSIRKSLAKKQLESIKSL